MAGLKRIVLFVEGPSDQAAAYVLCNRLLGESAEPPWDVLFIDPDTFRVGSITRLVRRDRGKGGADFREWQRQLSNARRTRRNLGAVLLLLDGDEDKVAGESFCPVSLARGLAESSRSAGGGEHFSVAVAFLVKEYESLFIASLESLPGRAPDVTPPAHAESIRGAKEWLDRALTEGYVETTNQEPLTRHLQFDLIRLRLRSFCRLERALGQLVRAVREGKPTVSPGSAPDVEADPPT